MRTRRWPFVVAALLALAVPAYWWFFLESGTPEGTFSIDLAEVRRLADVMPGDKATSVHFEPVGRFEFPKTAVVAGDGWAMADMTVYSYQLVFPSQRVIVDAAMDEATGQKGGAVWFDGAAFARVLAGMSEASVIVVTHEHFDHLAGLAMHPDVKALMKKAVLTEAQLAEPKRMDPLVFPPEALEGYRPLSTRALHAIAPGVVLVKAPGHTPGSQLVYVQRADGAEYLFLGDVAWHLRNVELVRERARLVTQFFLNEDRANVLRELAELNRLSKAEPKLNLIPGHDTPHLEALTQQGLFVKGFLPPAPAAPAAPEAAPADAGTP